MENGAVKFMHFKKMYKQNNFISYISTLITPHDVPLSQFNLSRSCACVVLDVDGLKEGSKQIANANNWTICHFFYIEKCKR